MMFWSKKEAVSAVKRQIARFKMRLFSAAETEEFWHKWGQSSQTIDQIIVSDRDTLLARSREQYANNDYVKRFVNLCQTNIVGENGIDVRSTVIDSSGQQDTAVQKVLEGEWREFSKAVDPAESMTMVELEWLITQGEAIDGEAFIIRKKSSAFKYGIAFYLIDPILCPVGYNDKNKGIYSGIRYDGNMKPVSYYFKTSQNVTKDYIEIPAADCKHVFLREWVGQKRGLPWVSTALGRLKILEGYEKAALINARVGATKMGFFVTEGDGQYVGEETDDGLIMNAEPGTFEQLPEGVRLQEWNPAYPHDQYAPFINANLGGIAVGLGVARHSLTGDMSEVNYTQGRTALLDERDMWKRRQAQIIPAVRWIYESFIEYGIDFGRITFNGRPLREQPAHYKKAEYQGRRWDWVDPQKDVAAAKESIDYKLKSRSEVIRNNGRDPDAVWTEIQRENQTLDSLGIMGNTVTPVNED